jgi:hypothetical protein
MARPVHERWGTTPLGEFYPALCGLSPMALPETTTEQAQVTCPECVLKRRATAVRNLAAPVQG